MTYNEILSAAQSLSETESRVAALIAAAHVTTVSARTMGRNASSARTAARRLPNIPARGNRSCTRNG